MKNRMILIAGRSGAGKDAYAKELIKLGLEGVKSYTTRPKRSNDEDTHIFITDEQAAFVQDKVATTVINGYEYFATRKQVEEADFYIIDPKGIGELVKNCPDTEFFIVYVYASRGVRFNRAICRGDMEKESEIFKQRDRAENPQFSIFEMDLYQYDNVIVHNNDNADIERLKEFAARDFLTYKYRNDISV